MSQLSYVVGDATQPQGRGNKVIVHVCNDVGGWGAGFVKALSRRWDTPERQYRLWAASRTELGSTFFGGNTVLVATAPQVWVANMIAQHGVRWEGDTPPIRYDWLEQCLTRLRKEIARRSLEASVHMPLIGCGLAGGSWDRVSAIVEAQLVSHGLDVTVYTLQPEGRTT